MIPISVFSGRKVALFGLGGSGLVTAKALVAGGADVVAFDDNPASVEKARDQDIPTANLREENWSNFSSLVLAPGVPLTHPKPHWTVELAKQAGIEIIGDMELFFRQMDSLGRPAPVVAITGTNGKSTTTALISHVLKMAGRDVQMGGNIGRAVLDLDPLSKKPQKQVYVIECSSYQIDLAPSLRPDVGILLNLSPDHLERHGTMENYASIKERLVRGSIHAVIATDDEPSRAIFERLSTTSSSEGSDSSVSQISVTHAVEDGVFLQDGRLLERQHGRDVVLADMAEFSSLRGTHNAQNALAALMCARFVDVKTEEVIDGFRSFPGLVHRMEQVGHVGPVLFINDSKATNAEAAAPALKSFEQVFWIIGGLAKEGGIASLAPHFSRAAKAYLIGEASGYFAAQLGDTIPYEISGTLKDAVNHAASDAAAMAAERGGVEQVVLLSPAAASFDQFPNFEKRGEAFKDAVEQLAGFRKIGS